MAKTIKKLLKSFTLIELIIVIAIIAVLGASAFLLLTQWMSKGRDAQRISDLRVIENALNIQITKEDGLPLPDSYNVVKTGTNIVIYQGKFGSGVLSKMNSLTKVPMDRQYGEYEYSLLGDKLTYKVQAIVENEQSKSAYINKVLADDLYYRYIGKDVKGIIVGNDFVYLPNMFLTGYVDGEQELGSAINNFLGNKVGEYVTGGIVNKDNKDGIIAMMTGLGLSTNDATNIFSKATGVSTSTTGTEQPTVPVGTNGECGTSNGGTFENAPAINLCNVGTASEVDGSGPWNWTCNGINGGINASCTANKPDTSWCYYSSNELSNAHADWNSTELKYDTASNKCYVFGDEDDNAKAACNKWVTDNATLGGEWIWTPARWFVNDGTSGGVGMKDSFYQRQVNYNGKDYVCRGFAVMKYEAKFTSTAGKSQPDSNWKTWAVSDYATDNDTYNFTIANGGITSKAEDYPIANIRQGEAIQACGIDGTYHLITNNEWMVVARNIEQQGNNWTSGTKGNGGIYRGNVNLTDNMSWSSYTNYSSYTYPAGNDTDPRGNGVIGNRRHILSNGTKLWDISGNVWEHVNKSNLPSTSNLRSTNTWNSNTSRLSNACGGNSRYSFYNNDGVAQCSYTNSYTYNNIGPATINLNASNGIGRIYSYSTTSNVFLRGGGGHLVAAAGLFSLVLDRGSSDRNTYVGLRCVR